MSAEGNKKLVDAWWAAFNDHDLDRLSSLHADDVSWGDFSSSDAFEGKAAVASKLGAFFTAFPDLHDTVTNRIATDDYVVDETVATGTNSGPRIGLAGSEVPATGKTMSGIRSAVIFKISDGKIVGIRNYPDVMSIMEQMGLMPGN